MSLARITKPIKPNENFWELNPWLRVYPPYSEVLKRFGEEAGSKIMIAIFLMCDPDEDSNPFFRMDEQYRKDTIAGFVQIDWEDELIQECLNNYPFDCMDSVERLFKEEKEKLKERAKFIKSTQYKLSLPSEEEGEVFDKQLFDAQVKVIGLMEAMAKNAESIYKQYERVEEQFIKGKSSAIARGGRRLTKAEKREV